MSNEVISAWDVYWVMQLDSISCFLTFATFVAVALAGGAMFIGGLVTDRGCYPSEEQDQQWVGVKRLSVRSLVVAAIIGFISALLPSSKTAAAMLILPAIANNETIQKEAGDLYGLAKEALREAVGVDEKDTKAE